MARKPERQFFFVQGSYPFPFDMLRYDSAFPVRESPDSALLSRISNPHAEGDFGTVRIMLASDSPNAPNVERWASFTWVAIPGPHGRHGAAFRDRGEAEEYERAFPWKGSGDPGRP